MSMVRTNKFMLAAALLIAGATSSLAASEADYKAALKRHPTFDTALFGRALAYAAQGNQAQATHDLKAARSINPKIDQQMVKVHLSAPAGL